MHCLKRLSCALVFCLAASITLWGATKTPTPQSPYVYVATGGNQIYAVSATGATAGQAFPLIPTGNGVLSSADTFSSLVVGPDNSTDNSAGDFFFLYACSTPNNTIVRLQLSISSPNSQATAVDTLYSGGKIAGTVCGRVDAGGDLYVSAASAGLSGSGVWVFSSSQVTNVPNPSEVVAGTLGTPKTPGDFNPPRQVYDSSAAGTSFTGGGITQKNNGDMLIVDTADNSILHAPFIGSNPAIPPVPDTTPFGPLDPSTFVTNLSSPSEIARISTNDFFVLNQGSSGGNNSSNNVEGFDPANLSAGPTVCAQPAGGTTLSSVAASEDNFVYVGVNSNSSNKQQVVVLDGLNCTANYNPVQTIAVGNAGPPLAIAVLPVKESPIPALSSSKTSSGVTTSIFNFGPTAFQTLTNNCTPAATQVQVPSYYLQNLLISAGFLPLPGTSDAPPASSSPVPYNGEGGFGTLYTITPPSGCSLDTNTFNNLLIAAIADSTQFTNPRIVQCDFGTPACTILDASGTWPNGYIPNDVVGGGSGLGFSKFFLANAALSGELGTFCGFQSPVIQTTDPTTAPIVTGNNLSVKFKLASGVPGNCSNGPYITDATALISVAQISPVVDGSVTMFSPVNISTQGSSADNPPIFKFNSSSTNYQFSLNLKGYAKGTYSLSITFLSNNAPYVYTFFAVP
jgi:hypothetical protein